LRANVFSDGNAQLPSTTINNMDRSSQGITSTSSRLTSKNGTSKFNRNGYQSGVGFDWDITPKDNNHRQLWVTIILEIAIPDLQIVKTLLIDDFGKPDF